MMAYTYTTYRLAMQTLVVSQEPDTAFDNILPSAIDYAEQRIYRELNLLNTIQSDTSTTTSAGNRTADLAETFVAVNSINVLSPAGSNATTGNRTSLSQVSIEALNMIWPGNDVTGLPEMFAMTDQWSIILGPSPDDAYALEVFGTFRPAPLSATNTTTFLTERLPDLFVAASMVFLSGYQRDFGAQTSDPQMSSSWEAQYQLLKASADVEELRKHSWAASWSPQPVSPQAQPQRG